MATKTKKSEESAVDHHTCRQSLSSIEDALYVIGGKWKLKIIIALRESGPQRFNELQRLIKGISARVLSNELKDLEMNGFVQRTIHAKTPVLVEYSLTGYGDTLNGLLKELVVWGANHREKILRESRLARIE